MSADRCRVRPDLGLAQDQRRIEIRDAVSSLAHSCQRFLQKHSGIGSLPLRIRRWKERTDIRSRKCAEQRVSDGVQQDVAIGVASQALGVLECNATNLQGNTAFELMRVPAITNAY